MLWLGGNKVRYYKFVHVFFVDSLGFQKNYVKAICDPDAGFQIDDHCFVFLYSDKYEAMREFPNVECCKIDPKCGAEIINYYADYCDWLICHSMCSPIQALGISKSAEKKIVWRTWGTDVGYLYTRNPVKNVVKFFINALYRKKMSKIKYAGIANVVDEIVLTEKFGKFKLYRFPYPMKNRFEIIQAEHEKAIDNSDICEVLLGHSGFQYDNHVEIIKKLEKYADENIHITIPLSYGYEPYIKSVKQYIEKSTLRNKITILEDYIPYPEYIHFLHLVDVAILDWNMSYALGNIAVLVCYSKKMVLNRNGILAKAFDHEGLPYMPTDQIGQVDFKKFAHGFPDNGESGLLPTSYEQQIQSLHELFDALCIDRQEAS